MRTLKLILSGWQSVGLVVFIMLFFNMEVSGKGKITALIYDSTPSLVPFRNTPQ